MPGEIKEAFCRIISDGTAALEAIPALKLTDPDDADNQAASVAWRARCDMWETIINWARMSHDKALLLAAAGGALK
jgi:hypothetical protein